MKIVVSSIIQNNTNASYSHLVKGFATSLMLYIKKAKIHVL